jgi:hypothetical protein
MPDNTTIVSMFFDLTSFPDANEKTRNIDFYLEHGKTVLELPYPLLFFCDETALPRIQAIRGTKYPTHYIVKNVREYDYFLKNWTKIHENRKKSVKYQNKQLKSTVSYYLLTMFKPLAIYLAKEANPFSSSHFLWIDLGCNYVCRNMREYVPKIVENPRPKVTAMYIRYRSKEELRDMREYMENGTMCGIAGGVFTVEKEYVDRFYNATCSIFDEMTEKGVGHFEEQVFTYAFDRYEELFTLYYGDYFSLFENYHISNKDINTINKCFIQKCIEGGREDLAVNARRSIL